jgi:hypothetical protein
MCRRYMVARRKQKNSLWGATGCDVYEVRPRKSRDGVDLRERKSPKTPLSFVVLWRQ